MGLFFVLLLSVAELFFVLLLSVAELVAGHVTQPHAQPEVVA
jgi:hypothetical protein